MELFKKFVSDKSHLYRFQIDKHWQNDHLYDLFHKCQTNILPQSELQLHASFQQNTLYIK